ncbi:protein kinase [Streptomyces sp. NPDC087917]|uniref:protein kinase domain-containing protein n=1 Tax=Streptomyces sp. NPDC087917 TaxID=3155060 RepID=UPI003431257A
MVSGGFAVRVGDLLAGRYRLDRRLGAGGMGEVWRGHDRSLDRAVAVKVLLEAATDAELIARFRREATIGARLTHPGITVVHDVGQHDGRLFIVMELLSGEDLAAVLARETDGLAPAVAVDLAAQTAEALAAAHEQAVVHRDLKPGNLFLLPGGRLKICDFGIAHSADATAGWTVTGRMFGTPPYMAPEQWRGEHVDARCDLYALGCVLYALLSGGPPFGSSEPVYALMRRHVEDPPLSLREAGVALSPELDRLVLALLAKDPADRPESAARVAAALREVAVEPTLAVVVEPAVAVAGVSAVAVAGVPVVAVAGVPVGVAAGVPGGTAARSVGGEPAPVEPGGGIPADVREFARELLREAEGILTALPPGAGSARTEGLALAAEASARFDAGLASRLLADAELWAWADGEGDGARVAGLLTGLARRISRDAPARTERVLTDAQQALFTVSGPARTGRLRKVAEELAAVAPERGVRLARRHFAGGPAQEAVLARAALASVAADPVRAEGYLSMIRSPVVRAATEAKTVTVVARQDLTAALRLAERLPTGGARVRALCRVAGERSGVGDQAGSARALALAGVALAELEGAAGAPGGDAGAEGEREAARAALEAAREPASDGAEPVLEPATARERVAAARRLTDPAERGRELAWIARDCTAGAPWLAAAAADPGAPPPPGVAVLLGAEPPLPPGRWPGPGEELWRGEVVPEALFAAGSGVVWAAGSGVGAVTGATGAERWTAHSDEGVRAWPLPEPERVWCAADADSVCVVVESGAGPQGRLVVREPADGRVRWWRELPQAPEPGALTLAGTLLLYAADGELTALDRTDGARVWRRPLPFAAPRTVTVSGECLVLGEGGRLRALHLPNGEPLWSWPRGYGSGAGPAPAGPASAGPAGGPVHVLDGNLVRALERRRGYELWRFDPGTPAARAPLVEEGAVYVAAYRPEQGGDVVFALDAESGSVRWQRQVTRREGPHCGLELLGVRRGVLYVRSAHGGRRGLLGRAGLPSVTGLSTDSGKPGRPWEHPSAALGPAALTTTALLVSLPALTALTPP